MYHATGQLLVHFIRRPVLQSVLKLRIYSIQTRLRDFSDRRGELTQPCLHIFVKVLVDQSDEK